MLCPGGDGPGRSFAAYQTPELPGGRRCGKAGHLPADRIGIPEAILAEGKDKADLVAISLAHLQATGSVIITRISPQQLELLQSVKTA